jgi:hypothetical protein
MSTYECTTVGCTLGDCPNCRYVATLLKALSEIEKGEGRYSRDPLTHASNTIEDMRELARAAVGASSVETHTN